MLIDALLLIAAGLVSGYASGLFGIGGGLLRIPIFLHLMPAIGVPALLVMHAAAGTSLSVAVPTSIAAARSQRKAGNVDAALLRTWLPALAVGVVIGIVAAHYLSGRVLEGMFAVMIIAAAVRMLITRAEHSKTHDAKPDAASGDSATPTNEDPMANLPPRPVMAACALVIGTLSPMLGITGGTFTTPTLTTCRYPIHRALAVSSVGGLVISLLGTIGFIATGWHVAGLPGRFIGYVDPLALLLMTPCVLVSVPLGVRTANRLSQRALSVLFGLLLVVIAVDVGWSVVFWHGG